mmetsp:Transcript_36196/g.108412  ORF Transcript_36196/g.108412 Transcript_36196/m.108412 type:complete len:274 (-) Transcript_36196:3257-4078(-)
MRQIPDVPPGSEPEGRDEGVLRRNWEDAQGGSRFHGTAARGAEGSAGGRARLSGPARAAEDRGGGGAGGRNHRRGLIRFGRGGRGGRRGRSRRGGKGGHEGGGRGPRGCLCFCGPAGSQPRGRAGLPHCIGELRPEGRRRRGGAGEAAERQAHGMPGRRGHVPGLRTVQPPPHPYPCPDRREGVPAPPHFDRRRICRAAPPQVHPEVRVEPRFPVGPRPGRTPCLGEDFVGPSDGASGPRPHGSDGGRPRSRVGAASRGPGTAPRRGRAAVQA